MTQENSAKYKNIFLSEGKEHISAMNHLLLKLEKEPQQLEWVSGIFREMHTLKSMAAAMKYDKTAGLCHAVEDILDAIRKKTLKAERCINTLFNCFDTLEMTMKELKADKGEVDTDFLVEELRDLSSGSESFAQKGKELFVRNNLLDIEKIASVEVRVEKLDLLMNLSEELLINRMRMDQIKEDLRHPDLTAAVDALTRLVGDIQFNVMQSRMVPVSFIFNRFPRMVRDLAKSQKKEVDLQIEGGDIELDRGVIDEIGESLVHLLKNAVDHGIESPDVRRKSGKPVQGTIRLAARRVKGLVVIEVYDDGAGLDFDEIKNMAIKRGVIAEGAAKEEIINAIFSGVSTTKQVTRVSGRGFGINIVKEKIESVGGSIRVESAPKEGAKFIMEIPLTLAIIKCLFVGVGSKVFAIPLMNIARLITVNAKDIKGLLNYEAIVLDEEDISLTRLDVLFKEPVTRHEKQPIVIIRKGNERLGLTVDSFTRTQEIVIKPLNRVVRENKYFAGSTIIGSGEVVLILDVSNLMLTKRNRALSE